jgi:hypothetical protein
VSSARFASEDFAGWSTIRHRKRREEIIVTVAPIGKHAIVIGAGMGGLAAAAAVAGHFERVTVVERDLLPLEASPRPGTPQDNHFFLGGLRALGELFPGFADDLARAGAVPIRLNLDFREEFPGFDPILPTARSGLGLLRHVTTAARTCRATKPAETTQHRHARRLPRSAYSCQQRRLRNWGSA